MRLKFLAAVLAGFVLFGCAPQQKSTSPTSAKVTDKMIDVRLAEKPGSGPALLSSNNTDFFVYAYDNRIYVIGSKDMAEKFEKQHHLTFTRTILGLGPKGETVVFEVDTKKPEYDARLQEKYSSTPALLISESDFWMWKYDGRIFVIGDQQTNEDFKLNHHLTFTRTILGHGPQGETVIFEEQTKKPEFVEALQKRYENTPILLKSEPDFWVWKYNGRIYVIGQESTNEACKINLHLPYT